MIFADERGKLLPIGFSHLPFEPKRVFVVYDVPADTVRGQHAHFKNKQVLVCAAGKIGLTTENEDGKIEVTLHPGDTAFHDSMEWAEITFLTGKDMLISLCSEEHREEDYIKDYNQFKELIA